MSSTAAMMAALRGTRPIATPPNGVAFGTSVQAVRSILYYSTMAALFAGGACHTGGTGQAPIAAASGSDVAGHQPSRVRGPFSRGALIPPQRCRRGDRLGSVRRRGRASRHRHSRWSRATRRACRSDRADRANSWWQSALMALYGCTHHLVGPGSMCQQEHWT
jgi:hypothetical protein